MILSWTLLTEGRKSLIQKKKNGLAKRDNTCFLCSRCLTFASWTHVKVKSKVFLLRSFYKITKQYSISTVKVKQRNIQNSKAIRFLCFRQVSHWFQTLADISSYQRHVLSEWTKQTTTYLTRSGLKSFSFTTRQFVKDNLSDGHLITFIWTILALFVRKGGNRIED